MDFQRFAKQHMCLSNDQLALGHLVSVLRDRYMSQRILDKVNYQLAVHCMEHTCFRLVAISLTHKRRMTATRTVYK